MGKKKRAILWAAVKIIAFFLIFFFALMYGYLCNRDKLPLHGYLDAVYSRSKKSSFLRSLYSRFRNREPAPSRRGRWKSTKKQPPSHTPDPQQRETMKKLEQIGYLDGYEKAKGLKNVTVYNPELAQNGLNLYCSGHGEEAVLMDMKGRVLHRWAYDFQKAFPGKPKLPDKAAFWRRIHLCEDGSLFAVYEGAGLIKLDKDSQLIWARAGGFHHDLFAGEDGFLYLLSRESKILPHIHEHAPVLEDQIVVLDGDGETVKTISILGAFLNSSFSSCLDAMPEFGDLLHTNTIEVFDGSQDSRSPLFKKGNILLSMLKVNVIAILDGETETIVWALSGQWIAQHQPTLLDNGNILLLDNRGHRGMSKVIEINPFTQEIVWAFEGTSENEFFTDSCGSNQRLSNGNTLITESDSGRAFEVTAEGKVVWAFYNPARAGAAKELIATLFEVVRLPADFPTDWMK